MSDNHRTQQPLIRDIPSFTKLIRQAQTLSTLKSVVSSAAPLLKLIGVDTSKMELSFANLDDLNRQIEELTQLPDRFNGIFAEHGWIIYSLMNLEVAKAAVAKADAGDTNGALLDLREYHSHETIRWKLRTMRSIEAFRPRIRLAEKALEDYEAARYHASIPVVLALMDGLVNELYGRKKGIKKGFSAEDVNLNAWDSISAHDKGLGVLAQIFQKGRYATTTEEISIPYRNGILHGMDLGYDTKMVAAKTWGALFAVRDWALKAEKDELDAPPEQPPSTLREIANTLLQNDRIQRETAQWIPRKIDIWDDIPASDDPEQYLEGTPERLLIEYLTYWRKKNFGYMAKCLSGKYALSGNDVILRIRNEYQGKLLQSFALESVDDKGPAITEITVLLHYDEGSTQVEKRFTFRLIYHDAQEDVLPRSLEGGRWQLITWIVY